MRLRRRLSLLFFIGILASGSTALGYYYYFLYKPPLAAGEAFLDAMQAQDADRLKDLVLVTADPNMEELRDPTAEDIQNLLKPPFQRGRILIQRERTGASREYHYLVYREPDGTVYAMILTRSGEDYKVLIPARKHSANAWYLWEYTWTN